MSRQPSSPIWAHMGYIVSSYLYKVCTCVKSATIMHRCGDVVTSSPFSLQISCMCVCVIIQLQRIGDVSGYLY